MGNYKNLNVWVQAKDAAVDVYKVTGKGDWAKDFRFRDQIWAAAVSVPSNIAEGEASGYPKSKVRYLHIAKGSCTETITQLIIAAEVGYLEKGDAEILIDKFEHCQAMIKNLIKAKKNNL